MLNENDTLAKLKHCYNKYNHSSLFTTSPSALYTQPVNKVRYKTQVPHDQSQTRSHGPSVSGIHTLPVITAAALRHVNTSNTTL